MSDVVCERWSDVVDQVRATWSELSSVSVKCREREGDAERTEEIIKVLPPWLRGEGEPCPVLDRYRRERDSPLGLTFDAEPEPADLDTEAQQALVLHAVRTEIEEFALGHEDARHTIRVACWGPKGGYIGSRTCYATARSRPLLGGSPEPKTAVALRDVEDAIVARMAATMEVGNDSNKAIAANYQALFADVASAYKGLMGMVLEHMRGLDHSARTKHAHVENLLDKAIQTKRAELRELEHREQPAVATAADLELKREALTKVTGIGERVLGALLGDRLGLAPEVVNVLRGLQEDPEVQLALQSPAFAESLRDPDVMNVFRSVLRSMADPAQGNGGAAADAPPPAPPS